MNVTEKGGKVITLIIIKQNKKYDHFDFEIT